MGVPSTNELPQRDCGDDALWPITVTRVAVSGLATIANGGTQQNLPKHVGALMLLGVSSGVVFGATGGAADQYLPVFHGSIFPMDGLTYWLATQAATADGTVFVAGFDSVERAVQWKELLGKVPPQQGAFAPVSVEVAELPAATALADGDANPTTTRIGANLLAWNGATWDRCEIDGQRNLKTSLWNGNLGAIFTGTGSDAVATQADANQQVMQVVSTARGFNGATWDRLRTTDDGETSGIGALLPAYREEYTGGPGKSTNGAVPGTLLSYTVPTGKSATIESITLLLNGAQALTQLAIDVNEASPAQTVRHYLGAAGTSWVFDAPITLNAGDAVLVKLIAAAGAANTCDISINARELR